MYYSYFGLKQPPFKITPDTKLFFPGGDRGAVLEALVYAITNGEGIVKVVGEVGSGKTMLCRMLEVELPEHVEIIYLANPSLTPENILHAIAFELHLIADASVSRLQVMQEIQELLINKHAENRQVVMFVEEAQAITVETLEEIRLLSNLETNQDKLLQIVLFGQPELDENLSGQEIRQLRERITYSFDLAPFKAQDIRDYVNSRLRSSGHKASEVFSPGAIRQLAKYSEGLLRRINILADKAMLAAYADNSSTVKPKHVRIAAHDSEFHTKRHFKFWPAFAVIFCGLIAAAFLWQNQQQAPQAVVIQAPAAVIAPSAAEQAIISPQVDEQVAVVLAPEEPSVVEIVEEIQEPEPQMPVEVVDVAQEYSFPDGTQPLQDRLVTSETVVGLMEKWSNQ